MKRTIPILALVCFVLCVYYVYSVRPVRGQATPPSPPPQSDHTLTVAAEGLVEPEFENIQISTPVPGLVTHLYVETGAQVHKNDPLFALDDRDLRADLGVKQAALASAKTRLDRLRQQPRPEEVPPAEARVVETKADVADSQVQVDLIESVTDRRAVREEDVKRRRESLAAAKARLAQAEDNLALLKAGAWIPDIKIAEADVNQAEAAVKQDEININRLTVRAPMDGTVLQKRVRLGQYAQTGPLAEPLIIFGAGHSLHVRATVDENEAWRVRSGSAAVAHLRGNSKLTFPLEFVRFEPYVIPKQSLTGDVTERVDTRALEVIYRFQDSKAQVFDGQQVDIFIQTDVEPSSDQAGKQSR
jgi:HlyD family secretion protein